MARTFVNLGDQMSQFVSKTNEISFKVGDLTQLTTSGDSDLVQAINQLDSDIGTLDSLSTTNKLSIVRAINELQYEIEQTDSADITIIARAGISAVSDSSTGMGELAYNNTTGVITFTGVSVDSVRTAISAGEGIDISSGAISGEDATISNKGISSYDSNHFTVSSGAVSLKADGIDDTHIDFGTGTNQVNTADVPELTNLYYTKARVDSDFDARYDSSFDERFATKTTANLSENTNLYYTTARADSDAKASLFAVDAGGDGSFTYDSASGVMTYTGPSASEVRAHITANKGVSISSGEINIDSSNVKNMFSIVDAGGDGSFAYDSAAGQFTYTGPSASEVRAHITAGEGIDISSGVVAGEDATAADSAGGSNKGIASFRDSDFVVSSGYTSLNLIKKNHFDSNSGANLVTLIIYDSAGSALKTLYSPGS